MSDKITEVVPTEKSIEHVTTNEEYLKKQNSLENSISNEIAKEASSESSNEEKKPFYAQGLSIDAITSKIKSKCPWWVKGIHVLVGTFFTAWWISIIAQKKHRHQWLIPTVFWLMLMVRLITWNFKILPWALRQIAPLWTKSVDIIYTKLLPKPWQRAVTGGAITVAVMIVGTFVPSETTSSKRKDRAVSFFGVIVAIFGLFVTSNNPTKIKWRTVFGGMLMQFIVALFVLRTTAGYDIFNFISTLARELLGFAKQGVAFLTNTEVSNLGMFFFAVLPAVVFFVAFVHIWYYFGTVQWFIGKFAFFFFWTLKCSGAEAVTAAASPFIGIGESAILIKDFMPHLTKAELHQVMCSGFLTISGAVLVGYIGLGLNPQALVSSCVMSIPASLAVSKLRYPETEIPLSLGNSIVPESTEPEESRPQNVLQAFSQGATLGIRIAGTMMAQTLCIIALVALINGILTWFGNFWNIDHFSLELILSYILYPMSFLLGTPRNEIFHVATLIATKFIQNEFVAYELLITEAPYNAMSQRGTLIATYALCGFSNLGSMGITLGVLNTLTNNSRAKDIALTIVSALISGGISTSISAAIAGMVIHDLDSFFKNQH